MIVVICCSVLFAWVGPQVPVADVEALIRQQGAREALHRLYSDDHKWKAFLSQVASGQRRALAAAAQLRTVSDAGASSELDLAAGEALKRDPANVLPLIPPFVFAGVCGAPDVDDARFDSAERAVRELKARQESVRKVQRPELQENQEVCLKALADAIPKVKAFFGKRGF